MPSDKEIIARIQTSNSVRPGWPHSHRLYYFDSQKGWFYLTGAGWALEEQIIHDPEYKRLLEEETADLQAWAKYAVALCLS